MEVTISYADRLNNNNRIYSKETLEQIAEEINSEETFGEFHYGESIVVNLANVSHKVKNAKVVDGELKAEVEILDSPKGKELKEKIDQYIFRTRGTGTVNQDTKLVEGYGFITVDAIPSSEDVFK